MKDNMQDTSLIARLYHLMLLIRRVEEKIAEIYHTNVIKSPVHLSIGQEAVAAGVCDPLAADDIVSNTYRCHATYLAKGGDLNKMMAELYGKKDGCAGGKAGSMHLIDIEHGILGASAVVGTTIPVAAGYAFALQQAAKKTGKRRLVVSLFGDGGTEEGAFSETLNFAALKQLPILFVCENNRLAIHTPLEKRWATERLCERVETYGIPARRIDDGDVLKIHAAVSEAVSDIRNGHGPVFIECATYRWMEHVGPMDDHHEPYRSPAEFKRWHENDAIEKLAKKLDEYTLNDIQQQVEEAIAEAIAFAEKSPFPGIEEFYNHVYA